MLDSGDHKTISGGLGGGGPTSLSTEPLPNASLHKVGESIIFSSTATNTATTFTQTTMNTAVTFSAKTCLELLPSLTAQQLAYETKYFESLLPDNEFDTHGRKTDYARQTALNKSLTNNLSIELDKVFDSTKSYEKLITDFSCTVEKARCYIEELKLSNAHISTPPSVSTSTTEEPVCFIDSFNVNISVDELIKDIEFQKVGNRQTAYFGPVDYAYGNTCHKAAPYPDSPALINIFNSLKSAINDDDFTRDNYSCLVTLYKDGTSDLPFHCDNEHSIVTDSSIYTVSLGDTRTLQFRNITGTQSHEYELKHGTAHIMTQKSQYTWEHSISPSYQTKGPRVSLTFRRHNNPTLNRVPPINEPQCPRKTKILFITDSIHSSFPVSLFPKEFVCIKKVVYRLTEIEKFMSEFRYVDYVFISCGINDISRYGFSARSLINNMSHKLHNFATQFPYTTFIFNSVLRTDIRWLNREVDEFNRGIFKLSRSMLNKNRNFWFIDTHWVVSNVNHFVVDPRGNGVHITHEAKVRISSVLRNCVVGLEQHSLNLQRMWPLRPEFRCVRYSQ